MMKFPTMEEFAKQAVDLALDEFEYEGKTIRAWTELILNGNLTEVVRCKDCKHWKDGVAGCTDHVKCCEIGFYMVGENGYCVYGEKEA